MMFCIISVWFLMFSISSAEERNPEAGMTLEQALPFSPDGDGDGIKNLVDNCPLKANSSQQDTDEDGVGDVCDNCPKVFNPGQMDEDKNGTGNVCDPVFKLGGLKKLLGDEKMMDIKKRCYVAVGQHINRDLEKIQGLDIKPPKYLIGLYCVVDKTIVETDLTFEAKKKTASFDGCMLYTVIYEVEEAGIGNALRIHFEGFSHNSSCSEGGFYTLAKKRVEILGSKLTISDLIKEGLPDQPDIERITPNISTRTLKDSLRP